MPRTTASAIRQIMEVDSSITNLTPFILSANLLVTECCSEAGYTDERLELIERFLAAHFVTGRDKPVTSETAGPVSVSYALKVGYGLKGSFFGQQAALLDTAGGLARADAVAQAGGKITPRVVWSGNTQTELTAILETME
jgi:hypothetical protein